MINTTTSTANGEFPVKISFWTKFKTVLLETRACYRQEGLAGVIRKYGWKVFAVFFAYYLIRDFTIYLAIPWLLARHFIK
jgi:hypothetical protein